ncbi:MAG: hypothetical protein BWK75_01900 [Candidatus Altiarchaeales archaeon A3]|nr:MAG: hypothetical protein BWK75_01900 [Candidatus Altiarchaeales archaeon A3]
MGFSFILLCYIIFTCKYSEGNKFYLQNFQKNTISKMKFLKDTNEVSVKIKKFTRNSLDG